MVQTFELWNAADLALAAYADLIVGSTSADANNRSLIDGGFASTQAANWASRYPEVVTQVSGDGGFSATIFESTAGHLAIAIRGTQLEAGDLRADAEIASFGAAFAQIVGMANWWLRSTSSPDQMFVRQYRIREYEAHAVPSGSVLLYVHSGNHIVVEHAPPAEAFQGGQNVSLRLASQGGLIDVIGHSLGGHLALAFSALFPAETGQVTVFNAPGFIRNAVNEAFFVRLGGGFPSDGHISNVIADEALIGENPFTAAAGLWSRPGQAINIPIENQWGSDERDPFFTRNHAMAALVDSLAVYRLLADLSPSLSISEYKTILNQASQGASASQERIVDALEAFFGVNSELLVSGGRRREDLYAAMDALRRHPSYDRSLGLLEIKPLPDLAGTLSARALAAGPEGLAYRYALENLAPFVVLGSAAEGIYAEHNVSHELEVYGGEGGAGELTEQWVADRAAFLERKLYITGKDRNSFYQEPALVPFGVVPNPSDERGRLYQAEARHYEDKVSSFIASTGGNLSALQLFIFGTSNADSIVAPLRGREDRLYGGGGNDFLSGGFADDYLEGGTGVDIYEYNAPGAVGPITNDGVDSIRDIDGEGFVRYVYRASGSAATVASMPIAGIALALGTTGWRSADGKFSYQRDAGDMVVTIDGGVSGTIRILDFGFETAQEAGYLGIRLVDSLTLPPEVANVFLGDREDFDAKPEQPGIQTELDEFGNVIRDASVDEIDRPDVFFGSAENEVDRFAAAGGNDEVYADGPGSASALAGGNDWLELGAGRDFAYGGFGDDLIEGGADGEWIYIDSDGESVSERAGDVLQGGAGDDVIFGGLRITLDAAISAGEEEAAAGVKGDFLSGGADADWLIGGATDDLFFGGGGNDIIVAGAGDDTIASDQGYETQSSSWSIERRTVRVGDARASFFVDYSDNLLLVDTSEAGADVVYAGEGSDWVFLGAGGDYAEGGDGDDVVLGMEGSDILLGGAGADELWGDAGHQAVANLWGDYLDGGEGNDTLYGDWGDDILVGGPGDDQLYGGSGHGPFAGLGRDTYIFSRGDGRDVIIDGSTGAESSLLVFGDGLDRSALTVRPGSMVLDFGGGDSVRFSEFDPYDPNAAPAFASATFADGVVMTFRDFLERGFDIEGTEANDNGHDAGHPVLVGTAFRDNMRGLGGNDELHGGGGDDVLDGGAGDDRLFGMVGDDRLAGGAGADALVGNDGDDVLLGGDGVDGLWGEAGDDILDGGDGADILIGGAGNDAYRFGNGDTAFDFDGDTRVIFGPGIGAADISLRVQFVNTFPTYIVELHGATSDSERMFIQLSHEAQLAAFEFADSTVLHYAAILRETAVAPLTIVGTQAADILDGRAGDDVLRGGPGDDSLVGRRGDDHLQGEAGDDALTGGSGNDLLEGGEGSDLYVVGWRDGLDIIREADVVGTDVLWVGETSIAEVTLARRANGDLVLTTADGEVTIERQYGDARCGVERIQFSDATITRAELDALTVAPIKGTAADDVLTGTAFDDALIGEEGADTLDGGPGDDVLEGGAGIDTYVLAGDAGLDTVVETGAEASAVRLASAVEFDDVRATRRGSDLVLSVRGVAGGLIIPAYYTGATNWTISSDTEAGVALSVLLEYIERVTPPDTPQELQAAYLDDAELQYGVYLRSFGANGGLKINVQPSTDAGLIWRQAPFGETGSYPTFHLNIADITGGPSGNVFDLRASGVVIADGSAGDDFINNQGNGFTNSSPSVSIGSFLYGNDGNDRILGTWAADTLVGGAGGDYLAGSDGDDTYIAFALDSGIDLIDEVITTVNFDGGHSAFAGGRNSTDTLRLIDVHLSDVSFSVGRYDSNAVNVSGTGLLYATLDLTWGEGRGVRVLLPDENNTALYQFPGHSYGVESIVFADGTTIALNEILSFVNAETSGIAGDEDSVKGSEADDWGMFAPLNVRTTMHGLGGNDYLIGTGQNDAMYGGAGDDWLDGGEGDDVLHGGPGNDVLNGYRGNDLYIFNRGDGRDHVVDLAGRTNLVENWDTLRFGVDIAPADIGVTHDSSRLYLVLLDSREWVALDGAFSLQAHNWGVQRVEFADGTVWSRADLLARTGVIPGSVSNDLIGGTRAADVIDGQGGDDFLVGLAGNDVLRGGDGADDLEEWDFDPQFAYGGNNLLDAGAGDDYVYHEGHSFVVGGTGDDWIDVYGSNSVVAFNSRDGADTVYVKGGITLSLGGGIGVDELRLEEDGFDLVLTAGSDSIRLSRQYESDPRAWGPIRLQLIGPDIRAYNFNAAIDSFYAAQAASADIPMPLGEVLEQHLIFASPDHAWGGDLAYAYARGELGSSLSDAEIQRVLSRQDFGVEPQFVARARGAAMVATEPGAVLSGTSAGEEIAGSAGNDWLNGAEGDDILNGGAGDDLLTGGAGADTYIYNVGDGMDVIADPSAGDGANAVQFGAGITPDMLSLGLGSMVVRIGDTGGSLRMTSFDPGAPFAVRDIDLYRFADGTTLTHESLLGRGFDLVGTAGAEIIAGTATRDRIRGGQGDDILAGGSGSDTYFYRPGDGADVIQEAADPSSHDVLSFGPGIEGAALRVVRDGEDIVVSFDAAGDSLRLAGWFATPSTTIERVQFSDGLFWTAAELEARTAANRSPALGAPIPDQLATEDAPFLYAIPLNAFSDPDPGDLITYSARLAGAGPLPGWLSYDATTRALTGVPENGDVGTYELHVTATDAAGLSASASFMLTVANVNDAPVARDDVARLLEDDVPFASGNLLANDNDVDAGSVLQVLNVGTHLAAYGTLELAADGSYLYNLDAAAVQFLGQGQSVADRFTYEIADNDAIPLRASAEFVVEVHGTNDAPALISVPGHQLGREGLALTIPIAAAFSDQDSGDVLDFVPDGALPGWLSLERGEFSGTPGLEDGGEYLLAVRANDSHGASAGMQFRLTVHDSLATGYHLMGTPSDDVLNGTDDSEFLDGAAGADRVFAGGGDDVLQFSADDRLRSQNRSQDFLDGGEGRDTLLGTGGHDTIILDDGGPEPRLAGIEYIATADGHDVVDLRSTRFLNGALTLDGGDGHDALWGSLGNDILLGGRGHDYLSGGYGTDEYVHAMFGGHDVIEELGGRNQLDLLRFADGIAPDMVRGRRHHDDLVLHVDRGHGSVRIKGWFAAPDQSIDIVAFADGTRWNEDQLRALVREHIDLVPDFTHREEHWAQPPHSLDEPSPAHAAPLGLLAESPFEIVRPLNEPLAFDFEEIVRAAEESGNDEPRPTPAEIARQWHETRRVTRELRSASEEVTTESVATGAWSDFGAGWLGPRGFGFEASIGAERGAGHLRPFEGLDDGFRRL